MWLQKCAYCTMLHFLRPTLHRLQEAQRQISGSSSCPVDEMAARPRLGSLLLQETTVRRTTTPVKRRNGGAVREADWQHEETVTVRRVRRMPAAEAHQHIGGSAGPGGPGVKTGVLLQST